MKYNLLAAAALIGALGMAASASAQTVSGTVTVTGVVTPKCAVVPAGAGGPGSFSGTIPLSELDGADGTLLSTLTASTATASAGTYSFRVACNSAAPKVSVSATRLSTAGTAPTGYSNDIDYTASADVGLAAGGTSNVAYTTASALPAATVATLGPISNTGSNNVTVRAYALNAENGPTSVLVAGSYSSTITITISPS
jgi:hypothetical protein